MPGLLRIRRRARSSGAKLAFLGRLQIGTICGAGSTSSELAERKKRRGIVSYYAKENQAKNCPGPGKNLDL
jgi:hypothetical protein